MIENLPLKEWQEYAEKLLGKDFMRDLSMQMGGVSQDPPHNMYSSSSEIVILINIPYVADLSQLNLFLKEQEITIKGKIDLGYDHLQVVEQQIFSGEFEKKIRLPATVNTKRVNAQYKRGILKIQLFPKLNSEGAAVRIVEG